MGPPRGGGRRPRARVDRSLGDPQRARRALGVPRQCGGLRAHAERRLRRDQVARARGEGRLRGRRAAARARLDHPGVRHAGRRRGPEVRHRRRSPAPAAAQRGRGARQLAGRLAAAAAALWLRRTDLGDRARLPRRSRLPVGPRLPRDRRRHRRGGASGAAAPIDPAARASRRRPDLRDAARQPLRRVPERGDRPHRRVPAHLPRHPQARLRGRARPGDQVGPGALHALGCARAGAGGRRAHAPGAGLDRGGQPLSRSRSGWRGRRPHGGGAGAGEGGGGSEPRLAECRAGGLSGFGRYARTSRQTPGLAGGWDEFCSIYASFSSNPLGSAAPSGPTPGCCS
jgi:hypothetical protein